MTIEFHEMEVQNYSFLLFGCLLVCPPPRHECALSFSDSSSTYFHLLNLVSNMHFGFL